MDKDFPRVNQLPPYVFDEIQALKATARKEGKDIIDFGMGNPDMPTPKHIREKLKETVEKPGTGSSCPTKSACGTRGKTRPNRLAYEHAEAKAVVRRKRVDTTVAKMVRSHQFNGLAP